MRALTELVFQMINEPNATVFLEFLLFMHARVSGSIRGFHHLINFWDQSLAAETKEAARSLQTRRKCHFFSKTWVRFNIYYPQQQWS